MSQGQMLSVQAARLQIRDRSLREHCVAGAGECENFYGPMHAPATGQAIAELILHRHFQTLDLTRLGWKRVAENRPFPKQGII